MTMTEKAAREGVLFSIIDGIKTDAIRVPARLAMAKVAPRFWEEAASTTGKYHPMFSLGDGGLVRHVRAAIHFAERYFLSDDELTEREKDLVRAAIVLHDSCKCGKDFESEYTVFEHPILVKQLLTSNEVTAQEWAAWEEINLLIASHMGKWNTPRDRDLEKRLDEIIAAVAYHKELPSNIKVLSKEEQKILLALPTPHTKLQKIVAGCDYASSDRDLMLPNLFDAEKCFWDAAEEAVTEDSDPATEKQMLFIRRLVADYVAKTGDKNRWAWVEKTPITKKKAGYIISQLKEQ